MKMRSRGFTLIEVALFLAITGALFIGIAGSVQVLMDNQRNNDAVQDFMEFLRRMYSEVNNVQNPSSDGGRSDNIFYGKLITLGEKKNLKGEDNTDKEIFAYTIVGMDNGGDVIAGLKGGSANVIKKEESGEIKYLGLVESYTTKWGAEIQKPCEDNKDGTRVCKYEPFSGTILIARSPSSGNISTYYSEGVVQVNEKAVGKLDTISDYFKINSFKSEQIDFCINVTDEPTEDLNNRFDVRILKNAHNASGIEYIPDNDAEGIDGGSNKCTK